MSTFKEGRWIRDESSLAVDERAAGVFLGEDPYRELELYLEKVNEEIGEVFDNWKTIENKKKTNGIKNNYITNGYRDKSYSESGVNLINGSNNNHKWAQNDNKINIYDEVPNDDVSRCYVSELNDIYKKLFDITPKQSLDMPCISVDSDPDYDEVFTSDGESNDNESPTEPQRKIILETRSKSVGDPVVKVEVKTIHPHQSRLYGWINNSISPKANLGNFLKKNKQQIPSLASQLASDAILTKITSLLDSDLSAPNSPNVFERRSTEPRINELISEVSRDGKRKFHLSKSVASSPNLSPKNLNNGRRLHNGKSSKNSTEIMTPDSSDEQGVGGGSISAMSIKLLRRKNIDREFYCSQDSIVYITQPEESTQTTDRLSSYLQEPTTCIMKDMETQTTNTPPLSRSSSYTCLSECSSMMNHTGSASEDEAAGVDDDISSSSSGNDVGVNSQGGGGEESGIGTASPPPRQRKEQEKGPNGLNKCKRKETWERLRRRQSNPRRYPSHFRVSSGNDIWVRRESVTTQTIGLEDDTGTSDHAYNTEDMSSIENLQIDYATMDAPSDNSLRKHILYRKYNESDSSANTINQLDESTKSDRPVRPSFLQLKNVEYNQENGADSPNSSGDCLDDVNYKGFLSQVAGRDQPSPSTASLKLSVAPLPLEIAKCSSVPVLKNNGTGRYEANREKLGITDEVITRKARAQSEKQIAEIEATEACKWLRAAGFPQYAQMYEDMQFPIDVSGVQSDHPFLDADSIQSLFRRLTALNRCANMKLEHQHAPKHTQHEESDEENQCALSENWQFERKSRRWSRVVDINPQTQQRLQAIADRAIAEQNARAQAERLETDFLMVPGQEGEAAFRSRDPEDQHSRFRRSGSERFRDGAKALLRHVESFKSKKKKRQNRDGLVISSPIDVINMNEKMKELNCFDVSPSANIDFIDFPSSPMRSHPPSPLATMPSSPMTSTAPSFAGQVKLSPTPFGDDSSSYCSDASQSSAHRSSSRVKFGTRAKKLLHKSIRAEDSGALSDSECQPSSWRHHYFKDANSNNTKLVLVEPPSPPEIPKPRERRTSPCPSPIPRPRERSGSPGHRPACRTGSLNLGKENQKYKEGSLKREKSASGSELSGSQDSGSSQHEESQDKISSDLKNKSNNVQRWHSFQRSSSLGSRPTSALVLPIPVFPHSEDTGVRPMTSMSCYQLQVLRKLALLKLTGYMEKNCPSHRTGWNWELPKFIRKIKAPDYKDKTVFGVPLLVSLQRTGHALPKPIRTALSWLRNNALDQVGIFRKAGVRSRTLRLRQLAEAAGSMGVGNTHSSSPPPAPATLAPYDEQQAHDVADMVKQYFRELPDALLTNKLSETFIAIFQHVPQDIKEDAVRSALLLLPEEHREALQVVLAFLQQVADHSATNQMTASNLAVCLAPTLLRLHHHTQGQGNSNKEGNSNRSASASPRRKRGGAAGSNKVNPPDPRELNESKAAHDCLLFLIKRHRELFNISNETIQRCNFSSFEESIPVTLDDLGSEFPQGWISYQQASIQALLKEAREKSRGWVSVTSHEPHVDLCYRKVGDGHPLRLWRITTEVEAPPAEVLHRILRERQIWDDSLLKCRVVERLGPSAEVFQYVIASMAPLQAKDYCVLRSWQTEVSRGGCCVVETSISHPEAEVMLGGVRAVVLASRYLIEPAGKGRSRLVHLVRVDTKGRTPEWYNKSYGHLCTLYSARIRASFKHNTDGPESNV